mmetsp:Transcript_142/g.308  ORF Transcript_142/g.308 Transcript_142/m.308 type:complete len:203 (-) Transcript_142:4392-5000(-)
MLLPLRRIHASGHRFTQRSVPTCLWCCCPSSSAGVSRPSPCPLSSTASFFLTTTQALHPRCPRSGSIPASQRRLPRFSVERTRISANSPAPEANRKNGCTLTASSGPRLSADGMCRHGRCALGDYRVLVTRSSSAHTQQRCRGRSSSSWSRHRSRVLLLCRSFPCTDERSSFAVQQGRSLPRERPSSRETHAKVSPTLVPPR